MSCRPQDLTRQDLTLDEALSDPMIAAALRADHVDPRHFEVLLRSTARRLDGGSAARDSTPRGSAARHLAAVAARLPCGAQGSRAAW